jgi:hypothetical protein
MVSPGVYGNRLIGIAMMLRLSGTRREARRLPAPQKSMKIRQTSRSRLENMRGRPCGAHLHIYSNKSSRVGLAGNRICSKRPHDRRQGLPSLSSAVWSPPLHACRCLLTSHAADSPGFCGTSSILSALTYIQAIESRWLPALAFLISLVIVLRHVLRLSEQRKCNAIDLLHRRSR